MALSFEFTAEQDVARDEIRRLLARVAPIDYVRDCDLNHRPPREAFQALAAHGWLGLTIPTEYDGAGGGPVDVAILLEETGRVHLDLALWLFRNLSHGAAAIGAHGSDEQKRAYLPAIASGTLSVAFALTEPEAGSDAAAIQTRAVRDGDGFLLSGQKWFTSGLSVADLCLVVARTKQGPRKRDGITNFLVDMKTDGVQQTPLPTIGTWALGTSAVHFDRVKLPRGSVLGTMNEGWGELREYLEMERLCLSAARVGAAEAALAEAVGYAKQRHQFGKPIGAFQAVSHMIAEMATAVEAARLLVYHFAWLMQVNAPRTKEAAILKLFAAQTYERVASLGVQVLGGYGYTMEAPMARHFRDSRLGTIGGGTSEIQRNIIARELGLPAS